MYLGGEGIQDEMGSKAQNLHLLIKSGVDSIPKGFIVTPTQQGSLENDDLLKGIEDIGGFPVAVRSSSKFEDLDDSSFAGLYESYLNVNNINDLLEKINECLNTSSTERVKTYLKKNNLDLSEEKLKESLCVLVQKMVPAKYAGVGFGINPLSGRDNEILLEVVSGLGEKLVSGIATPGSFTYDIFKDEIIHYSLTDEIKSFPFQYAIEVCRNILEIQSYFGVPQDVEWAIDDKGKVYILQSRPVTKVQWEKTDLEFTNADLKDGGISARVCTPMMFSLYEVSMNLSMNSYLKSIGLENDNSVLRWMKMAYGIGYWNSGQIKSILKKIPGFSEEEFDLDLGINKDYGIHGPIITPTNIGTILGAIPILLLLNREYTNCLSHISSFPRNFELMDQFWKRRLNDLPKLELQSLLDEFQLMMNQYYLKVEPSYFRVIYNNSNFQSDVKTNIGKLQKKLGEKINLINLFSMLSNVSHLEITRDLEKLKSIENKFGRESLAFEKELENFFKIHYHHSETELDLKVPRWVEDPKVILKKLESMKRRKSISTRDNLFLKELEKVKSLFKNGKFVLKGHSYSIFEKNIGTARHFLESRELFRSFSTRAYYIVRKFLLELGKRMVQEKEIENSDDIFYFRYNELNNKTFENDDWKKILYIRKSLYLSYRKFSPPNEFGGGIVQRENDVAIEREGKKVYKGIPCSGGTIKGKARVMLSLEEDENLKEDEILITKFTDPGWTPTLSRVGAVVTEVGGVLSHAAVISREYGIPAVLNISGITKNIKTGQEIFVDGDNGEVIIL